jgi:hypothetical protein
MEQTSEGCLQTSPAAKEERYWKRFCPWMTPMALSRTWPRSSLDSHFCSRQGPSTELLDYKFLGLSRDIATYGDSQWPFRRPHLNVVRDEKTWKSALPQLYIGSSAASPPTAIKILLKRESRRIKTSKTLANHDPRMNTTTPNIARC